MCGSIVDIQSLTAEIRRGKTNKKERDWLLGGLRFDAGVLQ